MSNLFNVTKEQIIKIIKEATVVAILAALAYFSGVLPSITKNPLVLAIGLALIKYLTEFFTDQDGKLGGVL
jgi:DNA-binding transcriptional ArsR family regulator